MTTATVIAQHNVAQRIEAALAADFIRHEKVARILALAVESTTAQSKQSLLPENRGGSATRFGARLFPAFPPGESSPACHGRAETRAAPELPDRFAHAAYLAD